MTAPRVHAQTPAFDERNRLVDFVMGLCSIALPCWQEVLRQTAPRAASGSDARGTPDDPGLLLDFMLGVASFASRIQAFVNTTTGPEDAAPAKDEGAARAALRDLSR